MAEVTVESDRPTGNSRRSPGRRRASVSPKAAKHDAVSRGPPTAGGNRRRTAPTRLTILEEQAASRIAALVPLRYARMASSPFAFFRGAAAIMAADLAPTPQTGLIAQLCGDAHLANFGGFATLRSATLFDINDFDETNPGPWEWDLKRLVASFAIAGRERGFSERDRAEIRRSAARAYRQAMRSFATMSNLDVWYARLDASEMLAA